MGDFSKVGDELWKSDKKSSGLHQNGLQLVDVSFSWFLHSFLKNSDFLPCRWDKNIIGVGAVQTVLHYMGAVRRENVLLYLALGHGDTHA